MEYLKSASKLLPCSQTLDQDGNACQKQTPWLIVPVCKLRKKSVANTVPEPQALSPTLSGCLDEKDSYGAGAVKLPQDSCPSLIFLCNHLVLHKHRDHSIHKESLGDFIKAHLHIRFQKQ